MNRNVGCAVLIAIVIIAAGLIASWHGLEAHPLAAILVTVAAACAVVATLALRARFPDVRAVIGTIAGVSLLALFAGTAAVSGIQTSRQRVANEALAQSRASQEAARARARAAERARAATDTIAAARSAIDRASANVTTRPNEALAILLPAQQSLQPLLTIQPPPALLEETVHTVDALVARAQLISAATEAVTRSEPLAQERPSDSTVIEYNRSLVMTIASLNNLPDDAPANLRASAAAAVGTLTRRREAIARQLERVARQVAAAEAYRAQCGNTPTVGGFDDELLGSEAFMRRTAHDPDSIDVENCTTPILTDRECWVVDCSVRGRNAFGARVLNRVRFNVARNVIIGADSL